MALGDPGALGEGTGWGEICPVVWGCLGMEERSCRDQEGRRGSEEAVPGPSVFPSGEPGVSGDFWVEL